MSQRNTRNSQTAGYIFEILFVLLLYRKKAATCLSQAFVLVSRQMSTSWNAGKFILDIGRENFDIMVNVFGTGSVRGTSLPNVTMQMIQVCPQLPDHRQLPINQCQEGHQISRHRQVRTFFCDFLVKYETQWNLLKNSTRLCGRHWTFFEPH